MALSCWRPLPAAPQPPPVCCPGALVVIQRGRGCLPQAVPLPASVLVTLSCESCTALGTNSCEAVDHRGSALLVRLLQTYKKATGHANCFLACSQGTLTYVHHCLQSHTGTSMQVSLLPSSNKPTPGNPSCWQQANTSPAAGLPTPEHFGMPTVSKDAPTNIYTLVISPLLQSGIENLFLR